jgi:hypothetical protein
MDSKLPLNKPPQNFNKPLTKLCTHKFYAIALGHAPGIYTSWPITQAQVHSFSGVLFQGFTNYGVAQPFFNLYSMGFIRVLFDNLTPNLSKTPFGTHISNWFSFQAFFGLRIVFLQHSSKKVKTFFNCCFCDKAWAVILSVAKNTGPINIHGCLTNISKLPPNEKK